MINKCFAKAKFIEEEIKTDLDDVELLEILEALRAEEKDAKRSSSLTLSKLISGSRLAGLSPRRKILRRYFAARSWWKPKMVRWLQRRK